MEGIIDELGTIAKMNLSVSVTVNLVDNQLPQALVVINTIVEGLIRGRGCE